MLIFLNYLLLILFFLEDLYLFQVSIDRLGIHSLGMTDYRKLSNLGGKKAFDEPAQASDDLDATVSFDPNAW